MGVMVCTPLPTEESFRGVHTGGSRGVFRKVEGPRGKVSIGCDNIFLQGCINCRIGVMVDGGSSKTALVI